MEKARTSKVMLYVYKQHWQVSGKSKAHIILIRYRYDHCMCMYHGIVTQPDQADQAIIQCNKKCLNYLKMLV